MDNRVILLKMISLIDKIENYISGMDCHLCGNFFPLKS